MIRSIRERTPHPVLFLGLGLAACESATGPDPAPAEITQLPRSLSVSELEAIGAANEFGFQLLQRLYAEPQLGQENVFISPLSASIALGMTLNGANDETYDSIAHALGLEGLTQEEINASYSGVMGLLLALDPLVEVGLANGVWLDDDFDFLPDYVARVEEAFDARFATVEFSDPSTATEINSWVEDATAGRIPELIDPERLDRETVAALLNALYFEGSWTNRFDPAETSPSPFRRPDGSTVSVPMMHLTSTEDEGVRYATGFDGVSRVVDLPYGGRAFSMTVVVPGEGVTLDQVVEQADPAWWEGVIDRLVEPSSQLDVWLPRFELTYEAELERPLAAMGMEIAFTRLADFSRMVRGGGPWIDFVTQKAFVAVDEEGTEATAATAVVLNVSGPVEIRVDRPFLFAIRERLSGTILFVGTVSDPTAR